MNNVVKLSDHFIYQFLLDKVILALLLLFILIAISIPDQAWASLNFMLDALVGIAPYLILAVALAAFIKASGLDQSVVRVFSGHPVKTILFAALFGSLSPFCSCGVIPLIASLLAAGVPLAPVMAFWIASPVMDPEMFILTSAGISLDFALAKAAVAIIAVTLQIRAAQAMDNPTPYSAKILARHKTASAILGGVYSNHLLFGKMVSTGVFIRKPDVEVY